MKAYGTLIDGVTYYREGKNRWHSSQSKRKYRRYFKRKQRRLNVKLSKGGV